MKGYYAAFVVDPLGNNIEIVYFGWILLRLYSFLSFISVDSAAPQEIFGGCITQHVPHPPATPKIPLRSV